MTSPIDPATLTSRATFRRLASHLDATNRDADTLRRSLLTRWSEHPGALHLERRLEALGDAPDDDARLAAWFSFEEPDDGRLVADGDPALDGLPDELVQRLVARKR